MPAAALPPMTSRQAKALHKKTNGAQFRYTPSQIERLDKKEEREERRKTLVEKDKQKKINKRKREEKSEKERAAKRRLLEEGKLRAEDTWGKVTCSQPRLSNFFQLNATARPGEGDEGWCLQLSREGSSESLQKHQDDTHKSEPVKIRDEISTESTPPQVEPGQRFPAPPVSPRLPTSANPLMVPPDNLLKSRNVDLVDDTGSNFCIAEDAAEEIQEDLGPSTPSKDGTNARSTMRSPTSLRSPLSEMSPSKVNIRSQEKPDTTSTPIKCSGLLSPPKRVQTFDQETTTILGALSTQDFTDDDELCDKENSDPTRSPSKRVGFHGKQNQAGSATRRSPPKEPPSPDPVSFSDVEDLFDLDTESFDGFDDELDDATLLSLVGTQNGAANVIVDHDGSPKKLLRTKNALEIANVKKFSARTGALASPISARVRYTPQVPRKRSRSPAPPESIEDAGFCQLESLIDTSAKLASASKSTIAHSVSSGTSALASPATATHPTTNADSFISIEDQDLLRLAEQIDASTRPSSPKKAKTQASPKSPLAPPSTQDIMLELVEAAERQAAAQQHGKT